MHEWSLKWKKNCNHIKTADSKENGNKAVDEKEIYALWKFWIIKAFRGKIKSFKVGQSWPLSFLYLL